MPAMKWNYHKVMEEAKKYTSGKDFKKHSRGAYDWCQKYECLKEATAHYPPKGARRKHTEDYVRKLTASYTTVKQFREGHPRSYIAASKHGFLHKINGEIKERGLAHERMRKFLLNDSTSKGLDYES